MCIETEVIVIQTVHTFFGTSCIYNFSVLNFGFTTMQIMFTRWVQYMNIYKSMSLSLRFKVCPKWQH